MHRRAAIRQTLGPALAALPTTGLRAFAGAVYPFPLDADNLPALTYSTPDESLRDAMTIDVPEHGRSLDFVVEARAAGFDYLDTLDAVALEVEQAVMSADLAGLADKIELQSTTTEATDEMESPGGVLTMTFEMTYWVDARDPQ